MAFGNHFDEAFQNRLVRFGEGVRMRRENLKQADYAEIGKDGSSHE